MAKHDEISSTEKLLDLIRKQGPSHFPDPSTANRPKLNPIKAKKRIPRISLAKNISVGIELGDTELKLAKIIHKSEHQFELLDVATIPFAPNTTPTNQGFISFLNDALNRFCGADYKAALWSAISSVKVENRYIRIPKLPKKQIPNAVYWVFIKEVTFNKDEDVLDFRILGDIIEDGIPKLEVMAYTAPQKEIFELREIFIKAGHPLTGISIVPFAVQNLLQTILYQPNEKDICNLFIGRDWSRIAIYSGGNLVLSRGIKSGMHSMVLCISEAIKTKSFQSVQLYLEAYKKIHAPLLTHSQDPDLALAQKIFFNFIEGSLPISRMRHYNILSEDQVLSILEPALERLVRQVERTFEHYTQNFRNDGLTKVMVSGILTANDMIIRYLGKQLDLPITVMDPFPLNSKFLFKGETPDSPAKREAYVPAIGMALSVDSMTPNFLFTNADREKELLVARIHQAILAVLATILVVLTGIYLWQTRELNAKETQLADLNRELNQLSPEASKDLVLKLFLRSKKQNERVHAAIQRLAPVAFLEEISQLTPANIRLVSYSASRVKNDASSHYAILLDGVIFGERATFESVLTGFMLRLKESPLIAQPTVINKRFEYYDNQEVMRFSAKLDPAERQKKK